MNHINWLIKANSDLRSSKVLLRESIFDTAIYHTQQSAEKSLKAFLCFKEQNIPKTHDLDYLILCCEKFYGQFKILKKDAHFINPYSTEFRYPESIIRNPDEEVVKEAIESAEKIYKFVQETIKYLEVGQKNIYD